MRRTKIGLGTLAVLLVAGMVPATAGAQAVPANDPMNFCEVMDSASGSVAPGAPLDWIATLLGEDAALLTGLTCAAGDLNGPLVEGLPTGNGLLDGSFELGVLAELVNNTAAYSSLAGVGGVDAAAVRAGFLANYARLYSTELHSLIFTTLPALWGVVAAQDPAIPASFEDVRVPIQTLFPALMMVLAGYATLGDDDSLTTTLSVASLLSLCDVISEGTCLVNDIPTTPEDAGWPYDIFPTFLGPDGDADGDGFTNREEYAAFAGVKDAAGYVEAALDPAITPGGGEGEGEGGGPIEGVVTITGRSLIEEGDALELQVNGSTGTYEWFKNGSALPGEDGSSLLRDPVTFDDAGSYHVLVTSTTKAIYISDPFTVTVVAAGSLPIAGGLGLAALAAVCAMAGAAGIRRRK